MKEAPAIDEKMITDQVNSALGESDVIAELQSKILQQETQLARMEIKEKYPGLNDEALDDFASAAMTKEGDARSKFIDGTLKSLQDLGKEKKKVNEELEIDAAGSTSTDGNVEQSNAGGMGPSSWGSMVDSAFA